MPWIDNKLTTEQISANSESPGPTQIKQTVYKHAVGRPFFLTTSSRRNSFLSSRKLGPLLRNTTGTGVCNRIVRNILHPSRLKACCPQFGIPLTWIIEPVVVTYLQQHNVGIFQHDNARPHTARHTQNILHIHTVNVLQWPARLPDLSPIEYLWDHLGRQARESAMMSTTSVILNVPCKLNESGSHWRSLENWFAARDVVVWQSWLRMVGTLGIEPCPNFYARHPSSFTYARD